MNIEQMTDKLTRTLQAAGFKVALEAVSASSASRYLDVSYEHNGDSRSWSVRVSDHELPPTYANAHPCDYEIGDNNGYAVAGSADWFKLVMLLCDAVSAAYPPSLNKLLTVAAAKQAALQEKQAEEQRAGAAQASVDEAEAQVVFNNNVATISAQVAKLDSLSGQKRRQLRSKFNQQWREKCNPNTLAEIARRSR